MFRIRRPALLASGLALTAALTLGAGVTNASATTNHAGATNKAAPSAGISFAPPAGYTVVESASIDAPNGGQTHGSIACPAPKLPLGGGVFVGATSTLASVNDSYPKGKNWVTDVDNTSGADTNFEVYAVCANRPTTNFSVTKVTTTANAEAQTTGTKNCPTGFIIGGGVFSNSGSTAVAINSSLPLTNPKNGWRVDINNGSSGGSTMQVWAICRKTAPAGYSVQVGAAVANPAGTQTKVVATCPGNSLPLSGGVFSQSGSLLVNVNSSSPSGNSWITYENNASGADTTATPYAVCAGK